MTDSESDTSNVFTFQNANTTVSAKGPNTNISNFSFRNQLTSTMYMPRNFERQRYAESAYDQRSMYYRRETSPMSIHSACDTRPRNFQPYYRGMGSQQSVFNGRSGSPMSMRSIDSTASVSAADIAFAFKNAEFNKYDLKVIKEAYQKLMKQRVRKRIEKRRNMRLFRKGTRRRSGDDSGEQGSNSSISSDDCRSVKTSYKENMSSSKSAVIPLSDFRNTVRDMPVNCPNPNFKQNTFKNMFTVGSANVNNTLNFNNTMMSKQSNPIPTQKERFKNGFLLPSQRFNRSVASSVILESSEKPNRNIEKNVRNSNTQNKHSKNNNGGSDSEEEEIFSEMTVREKSTFNIESQRKRSLDSEDDSRLPDKKRSKLSSPTKNAPRNMKATSKPKNINTSSINNLSFEFAKPSLPVRKSKPRVQEKLIAKSAPPLTDFIEPIPKNIQESSHTLQPTNIETSNNNQMELEQSETTQNSDVSMRPSFIKRKLFTQKLDVAEKANLSSDGTSSPHSNVYTLQKEKNKARKLVTNQSCLNRDVQEDNNLLDLIHKIVPAERMNITNQSSINQTKTEVNNKNKTDTDKWDITAVISMCNDDDISDTYTDEEIFVEVNTKKVKKINSNNSNADPKPTEKVPNNVLVPRDCKIVVEKLQNNAIQKHNNKNINLIHNDISKNNVKNSAKSFWDTDFESDAECPTAIPSRHVMENLKKANAILEANKQDFKNSAGCARSQVSKKSLPIPDNAKQLNNTINNTVMNNTLDTTRKFNMSTLSVRSHRTTTKKKCCNETCVQEKTLKPDNRRKMLAENNPDKTTAQSKKCAVKQKSDLQSCKVLDSAKSTTNTQNEKKSRSTSNARTKSPKEKTSKPDKRVETPKSKEKSKSKSKVEKSSGSVTKKPESQNKNSKNKENIPNDKNNLKANTHPDKTNKKDEQHKPPSNKLNKKTDVKNSKNNNTVSKPSKSKLNNSVVIKTDRPVRSCRASSQNRSTEVSTFNLNNSSDNNKSLRSRNINLSSSIENITMKIKPRGKAINNKNISHIKTRKSDVSFSLSTDTQTPTPKKNLAKNRADFFKGKRKT